MNKKRLLLRSMLLLLVLSVDNVFAAAPPPPPAGGPPSLGKPQGAPNMTGLGIEGFNKGVLKKVGVKEYIDPALKKTGSGGGAGPASSAGGGAGAGSAGTPAPRPGGGGMMNEMQQKMAARREKEGGTPAPDPSPSSSASAASTTSGPSFTPSVAFASKGLVDPLKHGTKTYQGLQEDYLNVSQLYKFKESFEKGTLEAQARLFILVKRGLIQTNQKDAVRRNAYIVQAVNSQPVYDQIQIIVNENKFVKANQFASTGDKNAFLQEIEALRASASTSSSSSSAPEGSPAGPAHPFPAKSPAKSPAPAPSPSSSSSSSAASRSRKPADNQAWYIAHLERGFTLLAEREKMGAWANANNIASSNDLIREMNKIGAKWFGKASAPGAGKGPERSTSPRTKGFGSVVGDLVSHLKPAAASAPGSGKSPAPAPDLTDPKGKEEDKTAPVTEFASIGDVFEIDTDAFDTFLGHNE